jgi:hypothetical protein
VEDIGLIPVTADDVVSPGDNINAKIDALIDRATVMVVELSSQWTRAEYDIAVARVKGAESKTPRRRGLEIIVVTTDIEQVPASARDLTIVHRTSPISEVTDDFADRLVNELRREASTIGRDQEPRRLLEAREYRAAVISAMTLLEIWFREHGTDRVLRSDTRHFMQWRKIRNEAVHSGTPISRTVAREIVEGVFELINRLSEPDH